MQASKERTWQQNRDIIFWLMDDTLYLARPMAFWGSDESRLSSNRGHFLDLVHLLGQWQCPQASSCLNEGQASIIRKTRCLSFPKRTQNDLVRALSVYLKRLTQKEVIHHDSHLCLETTDVSLVEQVGLSTIKQCCIQLCDVRTTTGLALKNLELGEENQPKLENIHGHGSYTVLYVHCHAHCLHLALVESLKPSSKQTANSLKFTEIAETAKTLWRLFFTAFFFYTFTANSPKHQALFLEIQKATNPSQHILELKKLSLSEGWLTWRIWRCASNLTQLEKWQKCFYTYCTCSKVL